MTPYLTAYELFHRDTINDTYTWADLLDAHLQTGALVSTGESFVLARPVPDHATLKQCLDLNYRLTDSSTWFVYLAAGNLSALLLLASQHKIDTLLYQRHDSIKLRRVPLKSLLTKV